MRVKAPLRAVVAVVPAFILGIIFFLGSTFLLGLYSNNVAYPAYMESLAMEPGDVGGEPLETTPEARSVADLEAMDTFFVMGEIYNTGAPYILDGRHYYQIILDNGERVLARINFESAGKQKNEAHQRHLPVGRWVPLEASEEALEPYRSTFMTLSTTSCYMDMMGDFGKVCTPGEYLTRFPLYNFLENLHIILTLVFFFGFMWFFKKKGWF